MTTKQCFRNKFTLQVRERDHNPPHVHLSGAGFDVTIDLQTFASSGVWPSGLKSEVTDWIKENQAILMKDWMLWHS